MVIHPITNMQQALLASLFPKSEEQKAGQWIAVKVCSGVGFHRIGTFRQMCVFNRMENRMVINRQEEISKSSFYFGCNKLNRLFITHLHGDHIFGLPSVILGISFEKDRKESQSTPIFLYGPAGIAEYLSTSFRVCNSKIACSLKICELCLPNQPCSSTRFNVSHLTYSNFTI